MSIRVTYWSIDLTDYRLRSLYLTLSPTEAATEEAHWQGATTEGGTGFLWLLWCWWHELCEMAGDLRGGKG